VQQSLSHIINRFRILSIDRKAGKMMNNYNSINVIERNHTFGLLKDLYVWELHFQPCKMLNTSVGNLGVCNKVV
jgi:hypothetical protein